MSHVKETHCYKTLMIPPMYRKKIRTLLDTEFQNIISKSKTDICCATLHEIELKTTGQPVSGTPHVIH